MTVSVITIPKAAGQKYQRAPETIAARRSFAEELRTLRRTNPAMARLLSRRVRSAAAALNKAWWGV